MTVIDSHLHVWDLNVGEYAWLGPRHGDLYASFGPQQARRELEAVGVHAAVLVQAEDSSRDTRYLLDVAGRFDFVAGVVGWVRLDTPAVSAAQLGEYGDSPALCGVRHLVHDDPRDEFLELSGVRRSLAVLAERGLPFDVPDAWPRHLAGVARLAADIPELTVVLDHLGKPPRAGEDFAAWRSTLGEIATRPNTVAKVSGLQAAGEPLTPEALGPVWEAALDTFGPARLMYGGDWPMSVPFGGYGPTWAVLRELIGQLSASEQAAVLGGTASRVYRLEATDVD